ncbi:hypothetical protein KJ765_00600 [Candidatus Micrarchaeota archaeon]|nr:hypothetical protein [Candidatus Micrarchaeota archaeon]
MNGRIFGLFFVLLLGVGAAFDHYPWIHTALYQLDNSWTNSEQDFVADHYDVVGGSLHNVIQRIHSRNPVILMFQFISPGYLTDYYIDRMHAFLQQSHDYTTQEIEEAYLHYECDWTISGQYFPGCNVLNPAMGTCTQQASAYCQSKGLLSNALQISQSRMPDTWRFPNFQTNWRVPHFNNRVLRDFSVWRIQEVLSYYPSDYPPDGLFWDNIISSLGTVDKIEYSIEYTGVPYDLNLQHPRDVDYHAFYNLIKNQVEQAQGRTYRWLGNVNNMFYIRATGPWTEWALQNLEYLSVESWVNPINTQQGEYAMPSWIVDCSDMKEIWDYTVNRGRFVHVDTYNFDVNGENPDMRTRVFSIGKYYLAKNPKLFYGTSEAATWDSDHSVPEYYWNPMAEINIGMPKTNPSGVVDFLGQPNTNRFFDWNHPSTTLSCSYYDASNVVMARHYDNGLVLVRWKGNRCSNPGSECNSYIEARPYALANIHNPSGEYYPILFDGSLSSEPITEVTLLTNEATLLLNACDEGKALPGVTCGCGGEVVNENDWCCNGAKTFVCTDDIQCAIQGPEYLCDNPGTCEAECVDGTPTESPTPTPCANYGGNCLPECDGLDDCRLEEDGYCETGACCIGTCTEPSSSPTASDSPTPSPSIDPSLPPDGNGGNGNGYYPTLTPTPTSPPSTPSVISSPTPEWREMDADVQNQLREVHDSGEDTMEVERMMEEALKLKDAGREEEAISLMEKARGRLQDVLKRVRSSRAAFNWQYALAGIILIVLLSIYYASSLRKKPPQAPLSIPPDEQELAERGSRIAPEIPSLPENPSDINTSTGWNESS